MRIGVGARLAISVAVFVAVLWFVDLRQLASLLAAAEPAWLMLALGANVAYLYLGARVLSAICGGTPTAMRVMRVNLISIYFGTFLPGDIAAGLVSRIRYLGLPTWQEVVNRTVVERLVSLGTFSVVAAIALAFSRFWDSLGAIALLVPVGVLLAVIGGLALARKPDVVLARLPWLQRRVARLAPAVAIQGFRATPGMLAWSTLAQFTMSVVPYAALRSLGADVSYVDAMVLAYLLTIAQLVPLFFAGIGIRDVSSIAMLGTIGAASEVAVAFATLILALILLMAMVGGLVHLRVEASRGSGG